MSWARVQAWKSLKGVGATSYNLSFTSNVTAGNTILVACSSWVAALGTSAVSDNRGNTYQRAVNADGGNPEVAIFYAQNVVAGATTVTVNATGGAQDGDIAIAEYSGLPASSGLDQTASGTGTGTDYSTGTTPALVAAGELCIAAATAESNSGTPTVPAPFTMQVSIVTTANMPLMVAEASSPTTSGIGTTFSSSFQPWAACIAVFKLAGAGSITGTASPTVPGPTGSAAGQVALSGASSTSLPDLTSSAAGTAPIAGTGAATLPDLAGSAAGTLALQGQVAASLPDLTASGAGGLAIQGAASSYLPGLTGSAAGELPVQGASGLPLPTLAATGAGALVVTGGADLMLLSLLCAGVGALELTGAGGPGVPNLSVSATGVLGQAGTGFSDLILPGLVAAGVGDLALTGAGAGEIPPLIGAAAGLLALTGALGASLLTPALSATGTLSGGVPPAPAALGSLTISTRARGTNVVNNHRQGVLTIWDEGRGDLVGGDRG